jgi:hypothetical protein
MPAAATLEITNHLGARSRTTWGQFAAGRDAVQLASIDYSLRAFGYWTGGTPGHDDYASVRRAS